MSACVTMFMTLSDFSRFLNVIFICHWLIYFLTLLHISYGQFCLLKQSYSTLNRILTLHIRVHLFQHKTDCQLCSFYGYVFISGTFAFLQIAY
jgi:hypothetical protein